MTAREGDEDMEKGGGSPHSSSLVGGSSERSGLVFRSNASAAATDSWHENHSPNSNKEAEAIFSSSVATNGGHNSSGDSASVRHRRQSGLDDDDLDPVTLPKSTHTLLFTEPINSIPFIVSVVIAAMSIICLLLALFNNGLAKEKVKDVIPANVDTAVKAAQYISIFIALLMEEEIPNGLYLLRRIPRQYFMSEFPELKYEKFVCSCLLRILMGYLFLINVLLTLIAADDVLEIFFDFIALHFLQQLDDIAFKLARMSMLSTSMREAATRRYFKTKFVQSKLGRNRISLFFVAVYFVNLCGLLSGMVYVSLKQAKGEYQCKSITVKFQEDIWEESIVKLPNGTDEEMILIYSYFNGVYVQDGNSHDERPVYIERTKFDGTEYDTTLPDPETLKIKDLELLKIKIPAKIQYCDGIKAWVFMHENIRKSRRDDSDCPWLLRSEETEVYDIMDVKGPWQVWEGVIETTDVRITCNECYDKEDCNLNGVCQEDGSCKCDEDVSGVTFLGPHCEVRLKDECRTILGEGWDDSYSVIELDWAGSGKIWQAYNRPIYRYISGSPIFDYLNSSLYFYYSGSRWFGIYDPRGAVAFNDKWKESTTYYVKNYHAFWDKVYYNGTVIVSDPTTVYTPVGVDFFRIGERGEQFGPFGARYPVQLYNQTGRGHYRCSDKAPSNANNTAPGGRKLVRSEGLIDFYRRQKKPN